MIITITQIEEKICQDKKYYKAYFNTENKENFVIFNHNNFKFLKISGLRVGDSFLIIKKTINGVVVNIPRAKIKKSNMS